MAGSDGLEKFVLCDRENEIIDLKWRGTEFWNLTYFSNVFQSGLPANILLPQSILDNILFTALTPNAIVGPSAAAVFTYLSQRYLTTPGSTWEIYIQNTDPVNAKVITFGAGFTPTILTIPPGSTVLQGFMVTSQNPPAISLFNPLSGASASAPLAGISGAVPGIVVIDTANPQTFSTTLITSANPNIVVTNGTGTPSPVVLTFGPPGFTTAGPPIQFQSALVWDPALFQWEPSSGIMNDPNLNIGAPGLRVGSNNSIQGPLNQYIAYFVGDRTGFGVLEAAIGSTALTQANGFTMITADSRQSPNFGTLARGVEDSSFLSILPTTAQNPISPFQGIGSYHFVGETSTGPATQVTNFLVTQSGMISQFTVTGQVGATALYQSAAGGITTLASLRSLKENISRIEDSEELFNALHPVHFNFKEDQLNHLCRLGFVVEDTLDDAQWPLRQDALFCYSCLPEGKGLDMSHPRDFDNRALIALLVDQVKTLKQQVVALTKDVASLTHDPLSLETDFAKLHLNK